jgi:hypothetical protein
MDNDAKSDRTEQIYFQNVFVKTICQGPLQQTRASCPRLKETASTMDQIHYIPQAGNQKKKGGKAPQERLLQLWPRPSAAEDKGNDHPG